MRGQNRLSGTEIIYMKDSHIRLDEFVILQNIYIESLKLCEWGLPYPKGCLS